MSKPVLKITLYKKAKCHLCDEMKKVLNDFRSGYSFDTEEIDIESDAGLLEKYMDKIPVLFLNGKIFAKYRIDKDKFRKKLENFK